MSQRGVFMCLGGCGLTVPEPPTLEEHALSCVCVCVCGRWLMFLLTRQRREHQPRVRLMEDPARRGRGEGRASDQMRLCQSDRSG